MTVSGRVGITEERFLAPLGMTRGQRAAANGAAVRTDGGVKPACADRPPLPVVATGKKGKERSLRPGKRVALAEPKNDSSTEPEIVLPVAKAIGDFCQEILGLQRPNPEMPGDLEVDAASRCHREMALPTNLFDPGTGDDAAQK